MSCLMPTVIGIIPSKPRYFTGIKAGRSVAVALIPIRINIPVIKPRKTDLICTDGMVRKESKRKKLSRFVATNAAAATGTILIDSIMTYEYLNSLRLGQ